MRRRHAGFSAAGRVSKGCALVAAVEAQNTVPARHVVRETETSDGVR
jgi:hypothetical protein